MNAYRFSNDIDIKALVKALKMWTTGMDGQEGGVGGIFKQIPYTHDMEDIVPLEDMENAVLKTIGRPETFSAVSILSGDLDEIARLDDWATSRALDIYTAYDGVVTRINDIIDPTYCMELKLCTGVENGFCQYEPVAQYLSGSIHGCIRDILAEHSKELFPVDAEARIPRFYDFVNRCTIGRESAELHAAGMYYISFKRIHKMPL